MMLYGTFRIIFWGIIFAIIYFLLIKKSKVGKKRRVTILTLVFCLISSSISALFPVENLFFSFKSPDEVLNYYQSGKTEDILNGNDSSMVIYSEGNSLGGHFIVPKSNKGYKIPSLFSVKKVANKFDKDGNFSVYNVLGTKDYYMVGTIISKENEISTVDSNNEEVKNIVVEMGNSDTKTVLLFSFIENFTEEYHLMINGKKILVSN
jgi:hypothetical protein